VRKHISIDGETLKALETLSERTGATHSVIIQRAVKAAVNRAAKASGGHSRKALKALVSKQGER
jgi:predicted transcriptional regulator